MRTIVIGALTGAIIAAACCRFIAADLAAAMRPIPIEVCPPRPRCVMEVYGWLPPQTSATCRPEDPQTVDPQ